MAALPGRRRSGDSGRPGRVVIAVDGKVLRGARLPGGRQVHLLSAYDTATGVVLAQVSVSVKSNEIPAFAPLLDQLRDQLGDLTGVVITADALCRRRHKASYVDLAVMPTVARDRWRWAGIAASRSA
jgi:hypothetical protein